MAIATLDQYIGAAKQQIISQKTSAMTGVAANFQDPIAIAGNPAAGVLAGTNTASGVVPQWNTYGGFPTIDTFNAGATGYLTRVQFSNSVTCRIRLVDVLFKAGAYSYNANQTLSSQPAYADRLPGGSYLGTELWVEGVTAFTGNLSVAITYNDHLGQSGATGTVATGVSPIVGRMIPIPLGGGDKGISQVNSVVGSVATAGTFNVLVLRTLWEGNIRVANGGDTHDFIKTGMPEIFQYSAIMPIVAPDSTSTGSPYIQYEIANG